MKDAINPEYYKSECSLECYQAIILALGDKGFIDFCLGSALEYMWRHKYKGKPKEDMEKAHQYLLKALEYADSDSDQWNKVCEFNHIWKKIYDEVDKNSEVKQGKDEQTEIEEDDNADWEKVFSIIRDIDELWNVNGQPINEKVNRLVRITNEHCI